MKTLIIIPTYNEAENLSPLLVELTYRAMRQGFRMVETPIVFRDRRCGKSKMSRAIVLEALTYVLRTRVSQLVSQLPPLPGRAR